MDHILVVEDEAVMAEAVCVLLKENGFSADYALTGEEGLKRLEAGEPVQLVLMDIHLGPGNIDGGAAARIIAERHGPPVVFYSGRDDRETLAKTREDDCYGYVRKGMGSEEYLLRSIRSALSRHATTSHFEHAIRSNALFAREANHRFRNGLAMVRSFLEIKQRQEELECDLSDVIGRIEALVELHSLMSEDDQSGPVNLQALLDGVLRRVFAFCPYPVEYHCGVGEIHMDFRDARALALLIAEIATNAAKHSFSETENNRFSLSRGEDEEEDFIRLEVEVTGLPIDPSVDFSSPATQGVRLIHGLSKQLQGSVEVFRAPHPRYVLRVPQSRLW